ncbi:ASKHA domain-containing protein [Desulfurivibrio alkaliphilus]|nr:ASKHA domain-containing protein [Desulfurivibrio alkaliphilus]
MFILLEPQKRKIPCAPELSLLAALQRRPNLAPPSLCGGEGSCGKCKIKILAGGVSEPSQAEQQLLTPTELVDGVRLACQTFPRETVTISLVEGNALSAEYKTRLALALDNAVVEPVSTKKYLQLTPPAIDDQVADLERIYHALKEQGLAVDDTAPGLLPALPRLVRSADWQLTATLRDRCLVDLEAGDSSGKHYGVAFDLGTTTMAAYLVDLATGRLLAQTARTNPQVTFGEDLMTRLDRAHQGDLATLQQTAVAGLNELLARLLADSGVQARHVQEATVVGNTCMQSLLLGIDPYYAGVAPFVPALQVVPELPAAWLGLQIAAEGRLHLPPLIAGFVGSDAVADLLTLDFDQPQPPHLLLDLGTNAEMALSVEGRVLACSAAAGPAFEGARISCGMRAAPGAIDRAVWDHDRLRCHTIDDQPARGIAGSGLISVAAVLQRAGLLNRRGGLRRRELPEGLQSPDGQGILLAAAEQTANGEPLVLTWKDLGEELVIARAAIRSGIEILLAEARLPWQELARISIAGAFGSFLDIDDALAIGLLPPLPAEQIGGVGNAAGLGAVKILLAAGQRRRARRLARQTSHVELSGYPGFNRVFARHMTLANKTRP